MAALTWGALAASPARAETPEVQLAASDAEAGDQLGLGAAINGDVAVLGAPGDDAGRGAGRGAASVYTRCDGTWGLTEKLTASDGAARDLFGRSVSLHRGTLLIGAWATDGAGTDSGSAYVFVRDADGVWSEHQELTASDAAARDLFGVSVAVRGDTAIVGVNEHDGAADDSGAAHVFTRAPDGSWKEQARLVASDASEGDFFGLSVALGEDHALIGASFRGGPERHAGAPALEGR